MIHLPLIPRVVTAIVAGALLAAALPALPVAASRPVGVIARSTTVSIEHSRVIELPIVATHVALHWRGNPDADVSIALSADGVIFDPLTPVLAEPGARADGQVFGSVTWTADARFARVTSDRPLDRLTVVALDASSPTRMSSDRSAPGQVAAAAVAQPAVISRAGWSADESLRFDAAGSELWPPEFHAVQKLIVHHTAGRNGDPDPAATVRAIYYYDAITKGWGDMGYNFLIDEAGHIYEGRYSRSYSDAEIPTGEDAAGNGVTGAHVLGYNSGTVGIALLGTLTNQDATPAARAALEQLLAWKADRHAIDPLGSSLYTNPVNGTQKTFANIAGHRDLAATECPGGAFYATFGQLRQAVSTRITGQAPVLTVPGAPVLTATSATRGKGVRLDWTVPSDGNSPITEYRVLRLKSGSFVRIATVGSGTTSFRDTATKRGRTYTYVVRAVNAIGVGPYSNQASAVAR